jgi:hypothetical protein
MVRFKVVVLVSVVVFCGIAVFSAAAAMQPAEQAPPEEARPAAQIAPPAVYPSKDVYAVKFLCGRFKGVQTPTPTSPPDSVEGPVKPGNYLTAINVHNPNSNPFKFMKKAVLMYRADQPPAELEMPMKPGEKVWTALEPDWGLEIDCLDIRKKLLSGPSAPIFIKGWVVIEVLGGQAGQVDPLPLDVTAVYTSHGYTQSATGAQVPSGFAEDVEPVLPKRVK